MKDLQQNSATLPVNSRWDPFVKLRIAFITKDSRGTKAACSVVDSALVVLNMS